MYQLYLLQSTSFPFGFYEHDIFVGISDLKENMGQYCFYFPAEPDHPGGKYADPTIKTSHRLFRFLNIWRRKEEITSIEKISIHEIPLIADYSHRSNWLWTYNQVISGDYTKWLTDKEELVRRLAREYFLKASKETNPFND